MALAHLTTVGSQLEAEMLCGELRANGIACEYRSTNLATGIGDGLPGQAGPREVLTDEGDLERARELLPRG
jgi:hypothetical protein